MMPTKVVPKEVHQERIHHSQATQDHHIHHSQATQDHRIHHSQATQDHHMSVVAMGTWSLAKEVLEYNI